MNKKLFDIKNFVTIVTGSSRSIGLKIASGFYEYGAKVIRIDLNLKKHKLYKFDDYIIDLTKEKLVDRCVNEIKHKYGRIDVYEADEAFLTSTPFCILSAVKLNGLKIGDGKPGKITKKLLKAWSDLVGVDIVKQIKSWNEKNKTGTTPYKFADNNILTMDIEGN